jgi:hypothetical protein
VRRSPIAAEGSGEPGPLDDLTSMSWVLVLETAEKA